MQPLQKNTHNIRRCPYNKQAGKRKNAHIKRDAKRQKKSKMRLLHLPLAQVYNKHHHGLHNNHQGLHSNHQGLLLHSRQQGLLLHSRQQGQVHHSKHQDQLLHNKHQGQLLHSRPARSLQDATLLCNT